jgi:hypothetical protein
MKFRRNFVILSLTLVAWVLISKAGFVQSQTDNLFVRGTVIATLRSPAPVGGQKTKEVALPHASVFLVPFGDRAHPVASTLSDLSGRFLLKTPKKGVFSVCVEADGFNGNCSNKEFSLQTTSHNFGDFKVSPKIDDANASLFGTLRLRDGHLPRGFYPLLGINAYATVDLATASGATYRSFVNNFGDYVIPQVPVKEKFTVQFGIDEEVLKRDVDPQTGLKPGRSYELSGILENSTPRIHALTATSNGKIVQVAALLAAR